MGICFIVLQVLLCSNVPNVVFFTLNLYAKRL